MDEVTSVIVGPSEHGVVHHATALAGAVGTRVVRAEVVGEVAARLGRTPLYHWHFTDRLFGDRIERAADALCRSMAQAPARHVVTLHDVPGDVGTARARRRAAAYASICATADAVVVASAHERRRLAPDGRAEVEVIPLPATAPRGRVGRRRPAWADGGPTIGVLGFVYPGKGHAEVLAAARDLPPDVRIVVLGRASDGHGDLLDVLRRAAEDMDRELVVTGFLGEQAMADALRLIDVPVVPAPTMSASASLGTWIAARRRPIAFRNRYVLEVSRHGDDLVTAVDGQGLPAALRTALDDPASTRRRGPVPVALRLDTVASAHAGLYRRLLRP